MNSFIDRVMQVGEGWTDDLSCHTCEGTRIPAEVSATRVTTTGSSYILASVRDISEQTEYEARLEALTKTTSELITAESVSEVATVVLNIVQRVLDCPAAAVWVPDPETDRLKPVEVSDEIEAMVKDGHDAAQFDIGPETVEIQAFHTGEQQFISDYGAIENPAHPEFSLESRFLLPLGEHGLLGIGATESGQLTSSIRSLLRIVAGNAETALDRLESERTERRRSAAVEAANDGIAILDKDAEFVYVNPAYADIFDYEDRETLVQQGWQELLDGDSVERMQTEVIPSVTDAGAWRGELTGIRRDGSAVDLGVALTRLDEGGYVNVCSDISDRKAQERRLKALNELNQKLMQAESWDEISRLGTDIVTDCLPFDVAAIRLFDREANTLELDAMTDSAKSLLESRPAYDLDATYAGTAYRRGEPVIKSADAHEPAAEAAAYASLHVPLRDYGSLSVLMDIGETPDDDVVEFVRLLGTALGIALERLEREQELRDGRDELTWVNRINTVVREIIQSLVDAATRDEIETAICERLVESDLYEYAWVGEVDRETEEIIPRASAGTDAETLQATAGIDLFKAGADTVLNAVQTGDVETVRQYRVSDEEMDAASDIVLSELEEFETVAAIPLSYGTRIYGVLILKTTRSETFKRSPKEEFELLGETAGFAINAVQNRQVLLSNRITELRFEVRDPRSLVVAVSDRLDCNCRLEIAEPADGGSVRCYLRIQDTGSEDPAAVAEELDSVERAELVSENDAECLLELIQTRALAQELATTGASIQTAIGRHGEGEVVLEVPQSADIRDVVDRFQQLYPDSELVAKRERKRGGKSVGEFRETIEGKLTDRQQAVLENAYEAGYFDWPRESTAEEVADRLDISSSTLHQHLRLAEWKLLSTLFD
ncbi:bacterio-opsin activator domain-containing protein [Haloarcula rubra]|nr:bacterio-opsin activator domain-containing protein [Halomicroarcula rubra]